jgi:hypothetical protein
MGYIVLLAIWQAFDCLVGFVIGSGKGKGRAGFWLGFFLGPIGWIVIAVMQPTEAAERERGARSSVLQTGTQSESSSIGSETRVCPYCAETIKSAAIKCRYCGSTVEPPAAPQPKVNRPAILEEAAYAGRPSTTKPVTKRATYTRSQRVKLSLAILFVGLILFLGFH